MSIFFHIYARHFVAAGKMMNATLDDLVSMSTDRMPLRSLMHPLKLCAVSDKT